MFTGIIEGLGTITGLRPSGQGSRIIVESDARLEGTRIGDSIAVNGACLTAVTLSGNRFGVDVSPETLARTTLGKARIGERVNLERALRLSDRLDGHLVSGHVDGMGVLRQRLPRGNALMVTIGIPAQLSRYLIEKGSVAVDGISLTVNDCGKDSFSVSIIPHTAGLTTIGFKPLHAPVNIEVDMIGKYVEKFLIRGAGSKETTGKSAIDRDFLTKTGFM
jgi:riboflavin synthase